MDITLSVVLRQTKKGIIVIVPNFDITVFTQRMNPREALSETLESIVKTLSDKKNKVNYQPNMLSVPLQRGDIIDALTIRTTGKKIANEKPDIIKIKTDLYSLRTKIKSGIYNRDIFRKHK